MKDQPIVVLTSGDQQGRRPQDRGALQMRGARPSAPPTPNSWWLSLAIRRAARTLPFPHRSPNIHACIDETLSRWEQLYAAGGAHNAIFPITLAQLQAATGGKADRCGEGERIEG
ncbi:MAG: hypothetical protein V9E89_03620 [Ilumatobacteraceae bacterium]